MAKKAELIEQAMKLKLDVGNKNTIAELTAAIKAAGVEPDTDKKNDTTTETPVAKAGKRSAKAIKETEEKQAKVERKESDDSAAPKKPTRIIKPTRSRLERRSKNFRKVAEQIDKTKTYTLDEALGLAGKTNPVKFDATVEMHIRLNVDPKHADQNVRDTVVLPAGTGKTVRIAVFSDDTVSGADVSGLEAVTKLLDKQQFDFDVLISTPNHMAQLRKYARVLGPRGLMPNPKSGTVTNDLAKAISQAKAGRVEYRVDSTGILHVGIGKVSLGDAKLRDNAAAVLAGVRANKPASIKGGFIKAIHVTTTMGPSIPVVTE